MSRGNLAKVSRLFHWGYKPAWTLMLLCCVTVTDPTPAKRSTGCVHSWEQPVASTDTPDTICCSCTPLIYVGCGTTQQGKTSAPLIHLGLQGHVLLFWSSPDKCCPSGSDAGTRVRGDAGQFGPWDALHCPHTWASAFQALTLLSTHTLFRIKALINEWRQGFDLHIVEAYVL